MVTIGPPASNTTISTQNSSLYFLFFSWIIILNLSITTFLFNKIFRFTWDCMKCIPFTKFTEWLTDKRENTASRRTGFVNVLTQTDDIYDDHSRTLSNFSMMALKTCLYTNRMRAHIPTISFAHKRMQRDCIYRCWCRQHTTYKCVYFLFGSLSDQNDFRWKGDI